MNISSTEFAILEARQAAKLKQKTPVVASGGVTKESDLHAAIKAECRNIGWIVMTGSMAHRTHRTIGEPDMVILGKCGIFLMLELKTATGKVSKEQQAFHAWAKKLGHTVHVVRSFEEFLEVLENH